MWCVCGRRDVYGCGRCACVVFCCVAVCLIVNSEEFVHTKQGIGRILSESGTIYHESAQKKTGLLIGMLRRFISVQSGFI